MGDGRDIDVLEINGQRVCFVTDREPTDEFVTIDRPDAVVECGFFGEPTPTFVGEGPRYPRHYYSLSADDARRMADFWAGVAERAGTEPTEVARLHRLLNREATAHDWEACDGGGVSMRVEHWAAHALAASFYRSIGSAKNYMQMQFDNDADGPVIVTVQRVGKVTPHGAREAAEAEVARLHAICEQYQIRVDGPTTFAPDEPPALPGESAAPSRPWLWLDATKSPNVLQCKRCEAEQVMPTPCPSSMSLAVINTFNAAHDDCQEGDAERLRGNR